MKRAIIKKLDTAWSKRIRQYDRCEVCSKARPLNAHHFYSRSIRTLRWELPNGFCLCVGCHVFSSKFSAHKTPAEFVEWAIEKRGKSWYKRLKKHKKLIIRYTDKDFDYIIKKINE